MLSGSDKELERFESAYETRAPVASSPFDRLPLLLHVAVLVPMVTGLALVVAVLLAQEAQVRGALNVLHLHGDSTDLWLSFAGACATRSGVDVCKISPAAAFYETVEAALGPSGHPALAAAIPPNLGAPSLLLVLSAVCAGLAVAMQTWGSADFHNAQSYQRDGRHGWLAELLLSRRLEILAAVLTILALALTFVAAASADVAAHAALQTLTALAPSLGPDDFKSGEVGLATRLAYTAAASYLLAVLLSLLLLSFDGLSRKLRLEYVEIVTDLQTLQDVPSVTLESELVVLRRFADVVRRASDPSRAAAGRQALAAALGAASCSDLLERQIRAIDNQRMELANLKALADPDGGDVGMRSQGVDPSVRSTSAPPSSLRPRYPTASSIT